MNKKDLLHRIVQKLEKIRVSLNYSVSRMSDRAGVSRTAYTRYLKRQMVPGALTIAKFGRAFGISLDWLLLDRGPQYYEDKSHGKVPLNPKLIEIEDEDTRKLVSAMALDPRLRHEVLLNFYTYQEKKTAPEDG